MDDLLKTVRLSASLRSLAGTKEIQVRLSPQAVVRDLLQSLKHTYPALSDFVVASDGGLNNGVLLIVGGRHIEFLQGLDTPLGQQDDLLLVPPLSGG
jgi:molybdopterin synthase sulfur carrier subunit